MTTYPAITPDGKTVAYAARSGSDEPQLYLRDINAFDARAVRGSSGAKQPFFSPDGRWAAFFAQGQLFKVEVAGGTPIKVTDAAIGYGGMWNEDDTIVYTPTLGSGLMRVPATGGAPESLTKPDGAAKGYAHTYPEPIPGGRGFLFQVWGQNNGTAIFSLGLTRVADCPARDAVARPIFDVREGSAGRILVGDLAGGIRAAPFDAANPGSHQRRHVRARQRLLRRRERNACLAGGVAQWHGRLRARQPHQDVARVGRPRRRG